MAPINTTKLTLQFLITKHQCSLGNTPIDVKGVCYADVCQALHQFRLPFSNIIGPECP